MRAREFFIEGDDKTPQDVIENHPEIWDFFRVNGGWMSFERYGKVETYNTNGSHMVVIRIQPTASVENLKLNLKGAGLDFHEYDNFGNVHLEGTIKGNIHWNVRFEGPAGNRAEIWRFAIPLESKESL